MVDTPRVGSDTGGFVAAPIFQRIAEASLRYLGVPQNVDAPPPIVVAQRDESPVTPTQTSHDNPTAPSIIQLAGAGEAPVLPDLTGQSARDALRTLAKLGMTARLKGRGVVVRAEPGARHSGRTRRHVHARARSRSVSDRFRRLEPFQ